MSINFYCKIITKRLYDQIIINRFLLKNYQQFMYGEYRGYGKLVHPNEAIVSFVLMFVCGQTLSRREGHYWLARFSALRLSSLRYLQRGINKQTLCQWWSGSKNSQQTFTRQEYMLSFEDRTLLLRETVTMLRNRDVIHRGPA